MSESQKILIKPPSSPPMDIPRKNRGVFNSFYPEPSKKNVITQLDVIRNNKLQFTSLKEELISFKENLNIFSFNQPVYSFYLFWAGFMTLVPLYLFK